ncbi:Gldg family protein [Stigmatella sp. ncwal1]|uniref:Gldg family protein n=1 Tax=Stigmatella ashevillensis TaxID=2995309 RepID=A0ABT5DKF2_9BACT|nr:Gldg family protein [Stigmatella ashevillena]MDC0714098.1 Gldg family protein [Stigmatella ashevillena]
MNPRGSSLSSTVLFVAVLVGSLIAERIAGAGTSLTAVMVIRLGVLLAIIAWGAVRSVRVSGERRVLWRWTLLCYGVAFLGLLLYTAQSELGTRLLGSPLAQAAPKWAVAFQVLFPALIVLGLVPLALLEVSAAAMVRAPVLETERARGALFSGLGTAFVLIFAFSAMYVATQLDATWDLSYFRTARPGESMRKVVRGLNEPLQVTSFFPPANDVGDQVEQYLRELGQESPQLQVERLDQAVEPVRARTLGVTTNGVVVFSKGDKREVYTVGLELDRARGQLQRLDQEAQRRLLTVARPRRVVYFTTGHGERSDGRGVPGETPRPGINQLKELIRAQNAELQNLGASEGLGSEVPRDAAVVILMGPTKEFLPEEVAALREYEERGGRLWIALDPDGPSYDALLEPLGLRYLNTPLANDQVFFRTTRQLSDRGNLGTATFSSHPSASTLSSLGTQAPVAFLSAGALEPRNPLPPGLGQDITVKSHEATFLDKDRDFTEDPGEERRPWPLVVAVEKATQGKDVMRAVVMADSDALSDGVVPNLANSYLVLDTLRWLTGEESISGAVSSEEDVPIQHTREQDVAWFYTTVFLGPVLVLGVGFFVTRRRGKRAPRDVVEGSAR